MAVIGGIEVDAVDLVDDLTHQGAIFHVVVSTIKGGLDQYNDLAAAGEDFQLGEQSNVHEVKESIASNTFSI